MSALGIGVDVVVEVVSVLRQKEGAGWNARVETRYPSVVRIAIPILHAATCSSARREVVSAAEVVIQPDFAVMRGCRKKKSCGRLCAAWMVRRASRRRGQSAKKWRAEALSSWQYGHFVRSSL